MQVLIGTILCANKKVAAEGAQRQQQQQEQKKNAHSPNRQLRSNVHLQIERKYASKCSQDKHKLKKKRTCRIIDGT